jgi:uncharacterized membrane protein YgaE (UPF0421/DUF939 family)
MINETKKQEKSKLLSICIFIALGIGLTTVIAYSFEAVTKIPISNPISWILAFIFTTLIWALMVFLMLIFSPPFKKFMLKWFASDYEDEQANLLKEILKEQKKTNEYLLNLHNEEEDKKALSEQDKEGKEQNPQSKT